MIDYTTLLSKLGVHLYACTIYEAKVRKLYSVCEIFGITTVKKFQVVNTEEDATEEFVVCLGPTAENAWLFNPRTRLAGGNFTDGIRAVFFEDRDMCVLLNKKCARTDVTEMTVVDLYRICKRIKADMKNKE